MATFQILAEGEFDRSKKRKPCVKTKASVELAFAVTVRNRRRIIEQTNDSASDSEFCEIPTGGIYE